jgi:hypothetical protein
MLHGRIANPPSKRIHAVVALFLREALRSSFPLLNLKSSVRPKEDTVSAPVMNPSVAKTGRTLESR